METWKDIQGYEGRYQVSNYGQVRSFDLSFDGCNNQKFLCKGRVLAKILNCKYLKVTLYLKRKKEFKLIHRLVAIAFIPKIEGKDFVNHKDCNKFNNHVDNLEWCTHAENMKHAHSNNLMSGPTKKLLIIK